MLFLLYHVKAYYVSRKTLQPKMIVYVFTDSYYNYYNNIFLKSNGKLLICQQKNIIYESESVNMLKVKLCVMLTGP